MVEGWVTALVVVFGVAVAVIGVVAYLRMFRKHADSAVYRSTAGDSDSHSAMPSPLADNRTMSEDGERELN